MKTAIRNGNSLAKLLPRGDEGVHELQSSGEWDLTSQPLSKVKGTGARAF